MNYSTKYAKNLLQKFKFSSMFMYYIKRTFMVFCIIFIILGLLISYYFLNSLIKNYKDETSNSIAKIDSNISVVFDDAASSARFISSLSNLSLFLYNKNVIPPSNSLAKTINSLQEVMIGCIHSSSYFDSIYIYSTINDFVISTRFSSSADKFYDQTFLEHYKNTGEVNFTIPSTFTVSNGNTVDVISCVFGIYDVNIPIGMVVFNIKREHISNIINNSGLNLHYFNIYNTEKTKIFSLNNTEIPDSDCKFCFSDNGILLIHNITNSDMTLHFGIKILSYMNILLYIFITLLVCVILTIVLSAVSSLYISANFYSSVQNIIMLLQNEDSSESDEIYDDMQFITDNIAKYIRDKKNLTHRLTTQIAQYRRLQSYTLQLQFNPHFLFNTLNIANLEMYKISKRQTTANTIISYLADLLEISLDTQKSIVTLSEEISYAQKYLTIQSICDDTFDVELNISDEAVDAKVPKLILQPILENAISHGIKYLMHKRRGTIRISATTNDNVLTISIWNNGVCMSNEQLENIRSQLKNNDIPSSTHIGLCNVFPRLKLIFDTQCELTINSSEDDGTSVIIKLPAEYDISR